MSDYTDGNEEGRYTADEIYHMFRECDTLDEKFKNKIYGIYNGFLQAMYNSVNCPEKTMKMFDTHGDEFQEEHNRFVMLYQKHHAHLPPFSKPQ